MFFDSWINVLRVIAVGTPAYILLVLMLRVSGKRTLSQLNAFDFIVTVAMGSTLANILLSPDVALAEGMVALMLLIALQFVITWTSMRSRTVEDLVKATPTLLFYQDHFLERALMRERVTKSEIRAAARAQGLADLAEVEAVVLETDGSITAIPPKGPHVLPTLEGVRHMPGSAETPSTE